MNKTIIKNATIINEGSRFTGHVLIDGEYIRFRHKRKIT